MSRPLAVVIGPHREALGAVPGGQVADVVSVPSLGHVPDVARRASASLLWLLDSAATPNERTLATLLDDATVPAISLPVEDGGRASDVRLGRFTESDLTEVLAAARRHRVPLRHTNVVSMLIEREQVLGVDEPDIRRYGRYAGTEWTARVFGRYGGLLVPSSVVRVPRGYVPGSPLHALRLARSGVWARGEALRELHRSVMGRRSR